MNDLDDLNLFVDMSDGTQWKIPVKVIIDSHAEYYASVDNISFEHARENTLEFFNEDRFEIKDWAQNNMNWFDVEPFAKKVETLKTTSYEEEWTNIDDESWIIR